MQTILVGLGWKLPHYVYYETAAMVTNLILLGKYLEAKANRKADLFFFHGVVLCALVPITISILHHHKPD